MQTHEHVISESSGTESADQDSRVRPPRLRWNQRPVGEWTIRAVTFTVIAGTWELYGRSSNPALFAPPSRVVVAFREIAIEEPILWRALGDSLATLAVGFAVAIIVGTLVGLLMGRFRIIEYLLDPYVSLLYALPMVAVVPLLIIWFGIGPLSRTAIVFAVSVIPVLLNTIAGAKRVSQDLIDVGLNYEANKAQLVKTVILPSILPFVFAGISLGIAGAIIGMVLGEMLVVIQGLGGLVVVYSNSFQPGKVFVLVLTVIALSVFLTSIMQWLRRLLMPWSRD